MQTSIIIFNKTSIHLETSPQRSLQGFSRLPELTEMKHVKDIELFKRFVLSNVIKSCICKGFTSFKFVKHVETYHMLVVSFLQFTHFS